MREWHSRGVSARQLRFAPPHLEEKEKGRGGWATTKSSRARKQPARWLSAGATTKRNDETSSQLKRLEYWMSQTAHRVLLFTIRCSESSDLQISSGESRALYPHMRARLQRFEHSEKRCVKFTHRFDLRFSRIEIRSALRQS